jgi:hypothetical protein
MSDMGQVRAFSRQSSVIPLLPILLISLLIAGEVSASTAVLPASSGEKIGAAFDGLVSPWTMDRASIESGRVAAVVCEGEGGACFEILLSAPTKACAGTLLPAWCVEYGEGAPGELRVAVESQFGRHEMSDFWVTPQETEEPVEVAGELSQEYASPHFAYLLALATLLVPLLLGLGLGLVWVCLWGLLESRLAGALLLLLPVVVAATLPMEWLSIGFYDLLLMGELTMLGFLGLAHKVPRGWLRGELALLTGGLIVGCLLVEAGTRLLPGEPPAFPPPETAALLLPESGGYPHAGINCQGLFPNLHPELVASRTEFPDRPTQILHLGDSMLAGDLVDLAARTVHRLNLLAPEVSHIDAGFSGTGPDHYYLAMRRWLTVQKADLVVWHLFLFNDAEDSMTHPYACCGNLPPLTFVDDEVAIRCQAPVEAGFYANRFVNSPAPYFLRVATHFSQFARYLCSVAGREARLRMEAAESPEEGRRRVRAVIRLAKAELDHEGIPMAIVMVPYRGSWDSTPSGMEDRESLRLFARTLCDDLQILCLDGREAFNEAVLEAGTSPYFISEPVWDYHFSPAGHRLYAEWLHEVLSTLQATK